MVGEVLRQTLQETNGGWKVLRLLEKLKGQNPGFDFRLAVNDEDRPIGVKGFINITYLKSLVDIRNYRYQSIIILCNNEVESVFDVIGARILDREVLR
jgi:hypothetical protein